MKIVGLSGSMRKGSFSKKTLDLYVKIYQDQGVAIQTFDLHDLKLPFCNGSESYPEFPDAQTLKKAFLEADGILLITPEYHGSISGAMKNALDLMGDREFKDKVVALVGVMAGVHSNSAVSDLRNVCRKVHAWVIPQQMIVANVEQAFNEQGEFLNSDLLIRAHEQVLSHLHAIGKLRSLS